MGLGCYLTKICYVSLGTKRNTTMKLRSITKEKEDHPKAVWTKNKENSSNTGGSRRPRVHGPSRPRAHGQHRKLTLEHPVCTGMYRAHGTPVCTGPTYPVRTSPSGWMAEGSCLGLHFVPLLHLPIYSVPRLFVRVSKGYDMIKLSFTPCTPS